MQPRIFDFDAYIQRKLRSRFGTLGEVARQKLLYAVHRLAIARTNNPAFDSPCEAADLGPMFRSLYQNRIGDPNQLSAQQQEFCDLVIRVLGATSGRKLAARSHAKYPEWGLARKQKHKRHCNPTITVEAIREQLAAL